jgi:hypothetical protein
MLPVTKVTAPAVLTGKSNGELPKNVLVSTPGLAGGPTVRLVDPAARSWRAMTAAALAAGITLKATSSADSYRTLDQQTTTFKSRYTRHFLAGRPFRRWQGHKWYQLPDTAVAAVPGTSNHGLGLAVDVAGADGARLDWLLAHAADFGWSWETQSEAWHIRYCSGDTIPAAVRLAQEEQKEQEEDDMAQMLVRFADDPTEPHQVWLCDGQFRRRVKPEWVGTDGKGPITNAHVHLPGFLGPLARGGVVFAATGDKDVWGIDIATLQTTGSVTVSGPVTLAGPVELTDHAVELIAKTTAGEIVAEGGVAEPPGN